ncbi:threonine-phosphate decarboxylase CobD [Clostridium aminobutyricum]|uniref:threonine-phosphate decarboxylase n=1 Tax=Clostridium aminobutyricum TaxID=33953 RepID=A0A939D6M3_CLOAM|nr:threonine-phosphate decarboxylase CobD [Clostridium aminobutyricum]MBN7772399.1 threonine-phosphate decarboxylase [Clostridium aminobutyricum]
MADLIHGGDIYSAKEKGIQHILDFSANINPMGLPERVKQAIIDGLNDCVNYPDPLSRELTEAIAEFEQIPKEFILCGNGAADIIFRMTLACKPKKALLLAPTFAEYEVALKSVGCDVQHYFLEETEGFLLNERFLESLHADFDMIFLCNPNNPTGQLIEKKLLDEIAKQCAEKKIWLVVDECFLDFVLEGEQYSMKPAMKTNDYLLILKAFTKIFAMPGLRLGYGMTGNLNLLDKLTDVGQPWSVSVPAQLAGIQALKEKDYLEESFKILAQEKKYLVSKLSKLKIKFYHPAANYIFLNFKMAEKPFDHASFKESLLKQGILIRDCSNYIGLDEGFYRIAVKSHQDNERLIQVLHSIKLGV